MNLFGTVQSNEPKFWLEKLSLFLCAAGSIICIYLHGEFSGFVKGRNATDAVMAEGFRRISMGRHTFEFVSEGYLNIFVALAVILLIQIMTRSIWAKFISLILIVFVIYESFQVFGLKRQIYASEIFDSSYFDIVRNSIVFDIIGATAMLCFLFAQIILVQMIFKRKSGT